jgi:uncharacterized protein
MNSTLEQKQKSLYSVLSSLDGLLVAYSGGTDSAYLAWAAHQVLADKVRAVLADSPSLARAQYDDAVAFAHEHNIPLEIVRTDEFSRPEYLRNDGSRCFHCKDELFTTMDRACANLGFHHIAYGMNVDDRGDFRPGHRAAEMHRVHAPLAAAGLTKAEVRELALSAGLRVWDKPASACLSSRLEYGMPVTVEALRAVEQAEAALRELGFIVFRVRHHGDVARVEIARDELENSLSLQRLDDIAAAVKHAGFKFVALDCEGFRSGSMNALLPASAIQNLV